MPLVNTARGDLYFTDHRRDDLPPMLLIHGAGGTHLDWPMTVRRLGSLAVDLNGHNKSPGEGHLSLFDHAADMVALLDALSIDRAVVCGQSMGGAIALAMALEYPDRVRGLVLIAAGARLRVHPDILTQAETNPQAVAEILARWLWSPDVGPENRKRGPEQRPSVVARDYQACDRFDVRERLPELRMPTLVLSGTADAMMPPKHSEALVEQIAGAEIHLFDGAGHMLPLERPIEIATVIERWLLRL